jgi:hypothetical protein
VLRVQKIHAKRFVEEREWKEQMEQEVSIFLLSGIALFRCPAESLLVITFVKALFST